MTPLHRTEVLHRLMSHESFELLWSKALYNYKELLLFTSSSFFTVPLMSIVVRKLIRDKKKNRRWKLRRLFLTIFRYNSWCYLLVLCRHIENESSCWRRLGKCTWHPGFRGLSILAFFLGFGQSLHRIHIWTSLVEWTQYQKFSLGFFSFFFFPF